MELVEVAEAPFSSGVLAAVRITPETVALRRYATLTFESRQPIDETQPLSGIAVRDGGELHLVRLGTYGVAAAASEEVARVLQHEPTEYLAHLEQRVAANPTELRGSKEFTVDLSGYHLVRLYGKPRTSKVQWNLQLCPK